MNKQKIKNILWIKKKLLSLESKAVLIQYELEEYKKGWNPALTIKIEDSVNIIICKGEKFTEKILTLLLSDINNQIESYKKELRKLV